MPSGRFAPSPTGRLHLGNLRTALAAWLFARADDSTFHLRFEDLDEQSVRAEHYRTQIDDLKTLGLDWDGEPLLQSDRGALYREALTQLAATGNTYPCYCTRREIHETVNAPNGPATSGRYPGTCRDLSAASRAQHDRAGRRPAVRLRGTQSQISFVDRLCGPVSGQVDDVVLARNDGTPAYNLAVVVDDVATGIELVVRGDDLLSSVATQMHLAHLLELEPPRYAHVPLVLGPTGDRLAKRDGSVTLSDRLDRGESPAKVLGFLAHSLGQCSSGETVSARRLAERFDPSLLPRSPLRLDPALALDQQTG